MGEVFNLPPDEMFDINFGHILEDIGDNMDAIHTDTMELIRGEAVRKNIEFDGYYQTRWNDFAETIVQFDEEYFDDPDRRDLYVYLSALADEEILGYLNQYYYFLHRKDISREYIEEKIQHLKDKGTRF